MTTRTAGQSLERAPSSQETGAELPPYITGIGEANGDGTLEVELTVKQDPRFTPERIAAMQGTAYAAWAEGEDLPVINLTNYVGSYSYGEGAMDSMEKFLESGEKDKIHLWNYTNPGDDQEVTVALNYVRFPEERREIIEQAGIHLNTEGFLADIDSAENPSPEREEHELDDEEWMKKLNSGELSTEEKPEAKKDKPADEEVSTEGLPESVTNNYSVNQSASGLLIAQSKTYHSSKKHKSEEADTKQRLMTETDTTLAGKPFTIVERPGSDVPPPNEPPAGASESDGEKDDDSPPVPQPQTQTQMEKEPPDEPPNHEREKKYRLEVGIANGVPVDGEDTILSNSGLELFGVSDGLGEMGENAANASSSAAAAIEESYRKRQAPPETVLEALGHADHALVAARERVVNTGGNTTAAFAKIENIGGVPYLVWAGAGHSRIFIEKGEENKFIELSDTTQFTDTGLNNYLGSNAPTAGESSELDDVGFMELSMHDRIVLCTAGITGGPGIEGVTTAELEKVFEPVGAQTSADALVDVSKARADKSVIVIDVKPV